MVNFAQDRERAGGSTKKRRYRPSRERAGNPRSGCESILPKKRRERGVGIRKPYENLVKFHRKRGGKERRGKANPRRKF